MATLCLYCGSSPGSDPAFLEAARAAGRWTASHGHTLVYGGGNVGLMGAAADAAMAAGGTVIGVIPQALVDREVAHHQITRLEIVQTMHERKQRMASLADAFLALPGGVGTLEEIIEVFVWNQLALHAKPCALLNIHGFYDPLQAFIAHMVASRFLTADHASALRFTPHLEDAFAHLLLPPPPPTPKWLDRPGD